MDEDGYLYIVDRIKELIKYKGYQVAPAELEALLATHPAIADVAVIGSPDEEAGEIPKAFVVLKGEASADQIMGYVAERVSPYKRIRLLEVVDQIPRSASGQDPAAGADRAGAGARRRRNRTAEAPAYLRCVATRRPRPGRVATMRR